MSISSNSCSENVVIAQISDSHLFADTNALHHGRNVYQHLCDIFTKLATITELQLIVFTGDLTQDHSAISYQNFVAAFDLAVTEFGLNCPLYWLAGNHDDFSLLADNLVHPFIKADKLIELDSWRLRLIDSKSATPAGKVDIAKLQMSVLDNSNSQFEKVKYELLFMHHHPIDVGYFIDKHGLQNKTEFWQVINNSETIKGICCGHIHQGLTIDASETHNVAVYTCPATSIQFNPKVDTVSALPIGPGLRLLNLTRDGQIDTDLWYL